MDRRRGARHGAHRLQLSAAVPALAAAGLLSGCFDGHLDTFEVAPGRGGQAGAEAAAGAGLGGTAGSAGASGAGGSAGQSSAMGLLIDDFEDRDNHVPPDGWWYPKDDETGPPSSITFDAISGRGVSQFGVHLTAGPTTEWGSFLGFDFWGPFFDTSSYAALSFFARMEPAGDLSVRFQDSQGTQFVNVRPLTPTWQEIRIPLGDFRATVGGAVLDPSSVSHLQLWLDGTRPAYHLYVDDMWLLHEP